MLLLIVDMNSKMLLYHGSNEIVKSPEFGKGREDNDYGRGFYCTESAEMAKEWACRNSDGYCNSYSLETKGLRILDLNSDDLGILHWITVLIENRKVDLRSAYSKSARNFLVENYHIDLSPYDVIRGYRADDSYFQFARDFLDNAISVSQLSEAMRLGKLGEQIVLKSEKAFENLAFLGCENASFDIDGRRRIGRDIKARDDYEAVRDRIPGPDDVFIMDLVRGRR